MTERRSDIHTGVGAGGGAANGLSGRSRKARVRIPPLVPRGRPDRPPLSFAQERLWFIDALGLAGPAYNQPLALRMVGVLDESALEDAFSEVTRRHEALRTAFVAESGVPYQRIDEPRHFCIRKVSLQDVEDSVERQRRVSEIMHVEQMHQFDLRSGDLLRALLVNLGQEENVLVIVIHHIVEDGWSLAVLVNELSVAYAACVQGGGNGLAELPVQYADYAIWQRQWLQGDALSEQLSYWQEKLSDASPQLRLPWDRPRNSSETFSGETIDIALPRDVTNTMSEIAKAEGATLFMVMLAAFKILLFRWSGETDIIVGTAVAGRQVAQLEGLIGFFLNTLPLRTKLSEGLTFREVLRDVKATALDAYANQDLPFDILVREINPSRDLSQQPVFQVMMTLENYPKEDMHLPGVVLSWMDVRRVTTHFDLTLYLIEEPGGLVASFEYATDLFNKDTICWLGNQFKELLGKVASRRDVVLRELEVASGGRLPSVIAELNRTDTVYPAERSIHSIFEEVAQVYAEACAIRAGDVAVTYGELNQLANVLARRLKSCGVSAGDCVLVAMERSEHMIVAELAVLKVGAAYVPFDLEVPTERRAFITENCGARYVLELSGNEVTLRRADGQPVGRTLVEGVSETDAVSEELLDVPSNALAYVMYTSGSTGIPKGVMVSHRSVVKLVINCGYIKISHVDRIAHCSNPAFDAATFEIWGALLNGAELVIVSKEAVIEPKVLASQLRDGGVTVIFLTTALFHSYAVSHRGVFESIRCVLIGGEAAEPSIVNAVGASRRYSLINAYGPTETTTFATSFEIEKEVLGEASVPIGRPIANTRVHILDSNLRPVPAGVVGDIYIGGDGLAHGYMGSPALTGERFIADPHADCGARIYRTGDLGKWYPDGGIRFVGRGDLQIKIRGRRIELGEIETRLRQQDDVIDAVVVVRKDPDLEQRLVAYVIPSLREVSDRLSLIGSMRSRLRLSLPNYMIPSRFILVDRFPLTGNGKVDRAELAGRPSEEWLEESHEMPEGATEKEISDVWKELLQVPRIGRHENFFDKGGHSLLAIQAVARLRAAYGVEVLVRDIFQNPTIISLAEVINTRRREDLLRDIAQGNHEVLELVKELGEMSEEEVEVQLRRMQEQNQHER